MIDVQGIKEELVALLEERQRIFNSLDSRVSRFNLESNTRKISMNTGFIIIEVQSIYTSANW